VSSGSSQATLGANSKLETCQVGGGPFTREKEEEAHARHIACSEGDVSGDGLAGEDRWVCCSAAPCSGSASQGKQRRGQQTWRHSGGGVCSTGRSSAVMGLWPGWSRDRGELGGDGCVVELEGRRAPGTGSRIGTAVAAPILG
jgi:hypothetical protein